MLNRAVVASRRKSDLAFSRPTPHLVGVDVSRLRNYGVAASDMEALWPKALKKRMVRTGRAVVLGELRFWQRVRFILFFLREKRRARRLDLSSIRAKGMTNKSFLAQQLEYLAMFAALARVVGTDEAVRISKKIMEVTAREALLMGLPDVKEVRRLGDPLVVFREYFRAVPAAARKAGCHDIAIVEETDDVLQFDISWCVWLELARLMGVPEACLPICHTDGLIYPDYSRSLGIEYRLTGTLAQGASHCDFRFERIRKGRGADPLTFGLIVGE